MNSLNKKTLSECDICTKCITPAIKQAGWDIDAQVREEVSFTKGRIIVRGRLINRGKVKRADYILYHKPHIPLAIIEAKDNNCSLGDGMQQALSYAETLDIPFVYSSNGDGFLEHDRTVKKGRVERELDLNSFPSPENLWQRHCAWKSLNQHQQEIIEQDPYIDSSGKAPRYFQLVAINRAIEAIAKERNRLLLVMATGTGKTYTAFQIIWRLWKAGIKKRILFLADRNILADQARTNDFKPFGGAMTKISNRQVDKSYEVYLTLYQAVSGTEEERNIYKQFSRDFFDLVVVDECHRGSAAEDAAWREILEYFSSATQIGMTATPKETKYVSNIHYFGEPLYVYSLRQGIEDGFLAPYKVIRRVCGPTLGCGSPLKTLPKRGAKCGEDFPERMFDGRCSCRYARRGLVSAEYGESVFKCATSNGQRSQGGRPRLRVLYFLGGGRVSRGKGKVAPYCP
jgi:type I restriction enzyme R subunit